MVKNIKRNKALIKAGKIQSINKLDKTELSEVEIDDVNWNSTSSKFIKANLENPHLTPKIIRVKIKKYKKKATFFNILFILFIKITTFITFILTKKKRKYNNTSLLFYYLSN